MRKYLLIMLALLGIVFSFSSCSSDDDDTKSLNGTLWVADDDGIRTFTFGKKDFLFTMTDDGKTETYEGTYTYTPPFVNLTAVNIKTKKPETRKAVITGNKLIFGEIVYIKKVG